MFGVLFFLRTEKAAMVHDPVSLRVKSLICYINGKNSFLTIYFQLVKQEQNKSADSFLMCGGRMI